MRLIDADALKKEYRMADRCEDCKRNPRDCQNVYSWTLMDVCSMLDDAPTIGGWISVKDRLPEGRTNPHTLDFEPVVCATTFGDVRVYKYGQRLGHTEAHFWNWAGIMDEYVTHWQNMPEMPKEENNVS